MARLFTSGFETNSNTIEWTASAGTPVIQIATIRGGKYAGELTPAKLTAGTPVGWVKQFVSAAGDGPFFARAYFRVHTAPSTNCAIMVFTSGSTVALNSSFGYLQLNTDRTVTLIDNAATSSGSTTALTVDTWYRLELKMDNSATSLTALLEGTQFGTSTNTAAVLSLVVGGNIENGFNSAGDWFFDDIAINDSTGATNNSFPGEIPAVLAKQNYKTLRPRAFAPGVAR